MMRGSPLRIRSFALVPLEDVPRNDDVLRMGVLIETEAFEGAEETQELGQLTIRLGAVELLVRAIEL